MSVRYYDIIIILCYNKDMKNIDLTNEQWKPIEEFPGYFISSCGRIYSTKRNKLLNPQRHKQGYLQIHLSKDGIKCYRTLHRLVALTFIPNPNNFKTVNHKNGIKSDNRVENLEWASQSQNNIHAFQKGLHPLKITKEEREDIKMLYKTKRYSQSRLAKMYNVCQQEIYRIVNDKFKSW